MVSIFQDFDIKQVPRKDNMEANALANLGPAFKIHPNIKIYHINKPTTEYIKEEIAYVEDLGPEDTESKDIGSGDLKPKGSTSLAKSWKLPILQYLWINS